MGRIVISLIAVISLFFSGFSLATYPPETAPDAYSSLAEYTVTTEGSVMVNQVKINFQAHTGVLELNNEDPEGPVASMFYVAYFKKKENKQENRPITFIYNGGPGAASLWLHMGAFGPKKVMTAQPGKTQSAPYTLNSNPYSLLNISDLVFIDAPGTGFSRFTSPADTQEKRVQQKLHVAKSVQGVSGDAQAFSQFIVQFLTDYQRWNSPKYLLGESYGTTRSVVLAEALKDLSVDLNGVILISPFLNYDLTIDDPDLNPGVDQPYYLALPTYAASAWYHQQLPNPSPDLPTLLAKVEQFALGPYAQALQQGSHISENDRQAIAGQLYQFTGIPADYWIKANLRIKGPIFSRQLLGSQNETIGRLDTRHQGPSLENLGVTAYYDPSASISASVYVAQFNDYLGKTLKFNTGQYYRIFSDVISSWDMTLNSRDRALNVLPNLANVMKKNPAMKIMVVGGVYDLATPYFAAKYEMSHLPVPAKLRKNIILNWYDTGHRPYEDEATLKKMHADLSAFYTQKP
jgi:carboxypeptidase C (cathepsin A)